MEELAWCDELPFMRCGVVDSDRRPRKTGDNHTRPKDSSDCWNSSAPREAPISSLIFAVETSRRPFPIISRVRQPRLRRARLIQTRAATIPADATSHKRTFPLDSLSIEDNRSRDMQVWFTDINPHNASHSPLCQEPAPAGPPLKPS